MPMLKLGRNHINTDRIVNVVTPSFQGQRTNAAVVTLAGRTDDVILYDEDADVMRDWLATQVEQPAPAPAAITTKAAVTDKPAPSSVPVAPVVTK